MRSAFKAVAIALLIALGSNLFSQTHFTAYDDLPGVMKSYKPALQDDFPDWAKMLYQEPMNYFAVQEAFERWERDNPGERNPIVRYYRIFRRAVEPFVMPDGNVYLPDIQQYYAEQTAKQQALSEKAGSERTGTWSFVGPVETFMLNQSGSSQPPMAVPWQVNIYSLDVAPSDYNILYAGSETGFVSKTTNKGLDWQLLGRDYFFGGGVTAIVIHPTDPNTVYVAAGNQVHKTVDGGTTWQPLLTVPYFYADRIRIDYSNPHKIVAGAPAGLFISENEGATWSSRWNMPTWDVRIKPGDPQTIYGLVKNNGFFGLAISNNGGQTFSLESSFPSNYQDVAGGMLAVTPANPNLLMAILLSSNNTPRLVRGLFDGTSWNWQTIASGNTAALPMDNWQGYFDLVLEISPLDQNIVMTGTASIYKSMNGGFNFSLVGGYGGNFPVHPDIQDMKMLDNGETWVATDGGMNFTTDNFTLLSNYSARNRGLVGSDFWGFDQGWNEDIVVGGRYHNGNTAIADFYGPKALRMGGAESPTGWILRGRSRHAVFDDLGNGWVLPPTAEAMPEGRFIFSKHPNMDEYGGRRSALLHHPNFFSTLYLGSENGFWRSQDMGVTWDLLHNFNGRLRYLAISHSNPDVIYADVVNSGLHQSMDGGLSWIHRPSLTSPPYGNAYWRGKLFFAISPHDHNTIYACLSNGAWSADLGMVFKSTDGGISWTDWTGGLSEYLKSIVVQPGPDQTDIVYLFTNATLNKTAKVFYRTSGMDTWEPYLDGYPSGLRVNIAMPFFRDGKLRVAGNGGVWEAPLIYQDYVPLSNIWVEKAHYNCMTDTVYLDDHSIINHGGASWYWQISPEPEYIDNPYARNPRVVFGQPGSYSVTMTITQNGQEYSTGLANPITVTTCPSIEDCSNPAMLPKANWSLIYVSSQEVNYPGYATMSFDGDPSTIWHTRWSTGSDPYPHEIQVSLGDSYLVSSFEYQTRLDGENGRIKDFELYFTDDSLNWGLPAHTGSFVNTAASQTIHFGEQIPGRHFRLRALSEVNGNPWASAAEFSIRGCLFDSTTTRLPQKASWNEIVAFPVPSGEFVNMSLPPGQHYTYKVHNMSGGVLHSGQLAPQQNSYTLNLQGLPSGVYVVIFTDDAGRRFRVRLVKVE